MKGENLCAKTVKKYSGPRFNMEMTSYQYRKSHCGDKKILRPSYLHNGISYTGKMSSLYWIRALGEQDQYRGYWCPGPHLNIKTIFSRYGDFHVKCRQTVLSLTWGSLYCKMTSLYWNSPLALCFTWSSAAMILSVKCGYSYLSWGWILSNWNISVSKNHR